MGDSNPKAAFKYPWDIVGFVMKEQRPAKPTTMDDEMYGVVDKCWRQDASDRIGLVDFSHRQG